MKNTLTGIAAKEAGIDAFDGQLAGPTAIAFIKGDAVAAAKTLTDFAKSNPELIIKTGFFEGKALDAAEVAALAALESREFQLARVAGVLQAPVPPGPHHRRAAHQAGGERWRCPGFRRSPGRRAPRQAPAAEATEAPAEESLELLHHPPPSCGSPTHPSRKDATPWRSSPTEELIEAFKEMTIIELSEFVKLFEETFDVTAAAVAVAGPAGGAGEAAAEEKTDFDVVLEAAGDKKIAVIKEVRALTSLGLKEAKDLVDAAPKVVLEGATKEAAEKAKEVLEAAGATVTLK